MVMLNASNRSSYSFDFVALFVTAMAGLVISAYLLSEENGSSELKKKRKKKKQTTTLILLFHFLDSSNEPRVCDLNGVVSCSRVLDSPFAQLFGIPVAALGVSWYLVLVWAAFLLLTASPFAPELVVLVLGWCALGCLFVVYLLLVELYLGAICPLCTIIHVLTFTHTGLAVRVLRRLLAEKAHLRLSDLVRAAIASGKPWLVRIAVLFVLPALYYTVVQGVAAGREQQLADALGVDIASDNAAAPLRNSSSFVDAPALEPAATTRAALTRAEQIDLLIECLLRKNVHMYGSQFCSHCHKQRDLFLPAILPNTVYVECVGLEQREAEKAPVHVPNPECSRLNITAYPTWIQFADDSYRSDVVQSRSGVTQLAELARRYDCALHDELHTTTTEPVTTGSRNHHHRRHHHQSDSD